MKNIWYICFWFRLSRLHGFLLVEIKLFFSILKAGGIMFDDFYFSRYFICIQFVFLVGSFFGFTCPTHTKEIEFTRTKRLHWYVKIKCRRKHWTNKRKIISNIYTESELRTNKHFISGTHLSIFVVLLAMSMSDKYIFKSLDFSILQQVMPKHTWYKNKYKLEISKASTLSCW